MAPPLILHASSPALPGMKGFMKEAQKPRGEGEEEEEEEEQQQAAAGTSSKKAPAAAPAAKPAAAGSDSDGSDDDEEGGPETRSKMLKRHKAVRRPLCVSSGIGAGACLHACACGSSSEARGMQPRSHR